MFDEGAPLTPVQRAVNAADFCNGTSPMLDFHKWTFSTPISRSVFPGAGRRLVILLNAETWIGSHGAGIAAVRLGDSKGYFGRAVQSLVIEKR